MKAAEFAMAAADLVSGDRANIHGEMAQNFQNIATLWNGYLSIRRDPAMPLDAVDVGYMMALLKIARTQAGSRNPDDPIDGIGYIACAAEIAAAAR